MAQAEPAAGGSVAPAAPAYAGVEPRGDKFVAWARVAGRRVLLSGMFNTALDAARASDRAHLLGGAAPLNFGAESYAAEHLAPLAAGLNPEAQIKAVKDAVAAPRLHGRLSRFRGVSVTKERNWKAEVRATSDATVPLGVFTDEAEAAKAYDRACLMLGREPANFPRADYPDVQPLSAGADVVAALRLAFAPKPRSSAFVGTSARKAGALGRGKAPAGPRWEAYIKVEGKKLSLGLHASEEAAARAYDRANLLLRGTAVNFAAEEYAAENLPRLTLGPMALSGDALRAALKAKAILPAEAAAEEEDVDEEEEGGSEELPRKRARLAASPKLKLCGVSLRKAAGGGEGGQAEQRWEAYAKVSGRKIALGVHASEEAGARAYDAAMLVLRGAARNFPAADYAADVASCRLARRTDVTAEELRAIAAPRWESHPTLLGVTRTRLGGGAADDVRWRAQLTVDGAALRWGTGVDADAAGFAYDVARMCIRGCPANAAPHDPRLAAVPRAAAELRGDALRAFVIAAVHDAFHRLGLSHAIVEAPAAPGQVDDDDIGPEQLLLDSDDRVEEF